MAERKRRRGETAHDGLDDDFGPAFREEDAAPGSGGTRPAGAAAAPDASFAGFASGIPCGKEGCFLKPLGDLVTRFALELARRGHSDSAARAATSGIELLRALRDFLDEEIAFAERAAEARRGAARYTKIPVE